MISSDAVPNIPRAQMNRGRRQEARPSWIETVRAFRMNGEAHDSTRQSSPPGPGRVTLIYALAAALWIIVSDLWLWQSGEQTHTHSWIDISKGLLFVLISSIVLHLALRRYAADLQRSRESLREQKETYRAVFESANDGMIIKNTDGMILEANPAFYRMHGYTIEELRGMNAAELAHPEHRHHLVEMSRYVLEGGQYQDQRLNRRKDGTALAVEVRSSLLMYRGQPCILSVVRDATERIRSENELRESRRFLRAALDAMLSHIAILDEKGRILTVNAAWQRFSGTHACTYLTGDVGADYIQICEEADGTDGPVIAAGIRDVLARRRDTFAHEYASTDPRSNQWYSLRVSRFNEPGPDRVVIEHVDISERKRTDQALARQSEELARSNTELERFAYVASHDLQEPLRMVASYTQLLARRYKGQLDEEADEFIAYAVDGCARMQSLINDLLAYSRVGSQGRPPSPNDAQAALERALANLRLTIQENEATVTSDALPMVMADATQLAQVFQNLIGNAIKFRGEAAPNVHISARADAGGWVFSVADNGIGIEPEYFDKIFTIFNRLHARDKYPGTGIGLTICKRIIERHGGRIWVESQPGGGSVFYFTLPAVPEPSAG